VAMLTRDGLDLHYEVTGSGPALLLPKFNYFRWDRYLDVGLLAGRFTVVVASPRGFMASSRLAAGGEYRVTDLAGDVVAVMEAAGFGRFSVFGYSFTGAFAPWLAHLTDRVDAVVSGGFPIVGDHSPQYAGIQARTEAARADPAAWSEVTSRFDSRAALGFYRGCRSCRRTSWSTTCRARCSRSGRGRRGDRFRRWRAAARLRAGPPQA